VATQTEKQLQAIRVDMAVLEQQLQSVRAELQAMRELATRVTAMEAEFAPLRELPKQTAALQSQVAVLQTQVAESVKSREVWGQRGWAILQMLLAAGAGAVLTYLIRPKS